MMAQKLSKQTSAETEKQNGRIAAHGTIAAHGIVIGSSIAGLTAAKTLANYVNQVTIIERDEPVFAHNFRSGVPQARHAHTLMPDGQKILEKLFPDMTAELIRKGAVPVDIEKEVAFFHDGAWRNPQQFGRKLSISCSRPMLESAIYQHVTALPNVTVMRGYQAVGLAADVSGQRVAGVRLRSGRGAGAKKLVQPADLVIDASGRQSQAPKWLASLKLTPPEEWRINAFVGYVTRIYQQPANFAESWKRLYIRPTPPDSTRGAIILPEENGRWIVTLIGIAGDYPPTDEDGFLAYAQSLPTPQLYNAIKSARPLSDPFGFRQTENRVRRYDKLPRYLEGFMVMGDAVCALNPVYAQGMTAAIMGSHALETTLKAHQHNLAAGNVVGLAAAFQKGLHETLNRLWTQSTCKDWEWPMTEVTDDAETLPNFV